MRPFHWFAVICIACCLTLASLAQDSSLIVVATTTIIADIAQNVGGDLVHVHSLVPPDSDTHAFELRPTDAVALEEAQLVLANGLGLESFLGDLLETANVEVATVSAGITPLVMDEDHENDADADNHDDEVAPECEGEAQAEHSEDATEEAHEHGPCDPHIWGDPRNVMLMADGIADAFAAADPDNAEVYYANAEVYKAQLEALDAEIERILSVIPPENRVVVTNHEFMGYFAARYDLTIIGTVIPGGSTLAEPSPRELAELVDVIRDNGVRAIFAEVSDTRGLSQVLAQEVGDEVQVVTLYSESLSAPDGPAATYVDYMRYNATAIATALGE